MEEKVSIGEEEGETNVISSVENFTIVEIKLSLTVIPRIVFQSVVFSPKSKHIDSKAIFTAAGGFAIDLISTKCCLRIPLTAEKGGQIYKEGKG